MPIAEGRYENGLLTASLVGHIDSGNAARLDEIADRAKVIGYTRLLRRTIRRQSGAAAGQAVIANCKTRLAQLPDRVDTLVF